MANTMNAEIQRNLGEQPIAGIMLNDHLTRHDLVAISVQHITHKMVARACKGRRLTPNSKSLILDALNQASHKTYSMREVFNY